MTACVACPAAEPEPSKPLSDARAIGPTTKRCDAKMLTRLADWIGDRPEHLQGKELVSQLGSACSKALPGVIMAYYTYPREPGEALDPGLDGLILAACPEWTRSAATQWGAQAVYRACGFDRFEVIDEQQLRGPVPLIVSWALYPWWLDQGMTPAQARSLTLALMRRERRLSGFPVPEFGQRFPAARGQPVPAGIIVEMNREAIVFDDEVIEYVRRDEDGHLLDYGGFVSTTLERAQEHREQRGDSWRVPLLLAAVAETSFATLMDLAGSAQAEGFDDLRLVVESPDGIEQIPFMLRPRQTDRAAAAEQPAFSSIEIAADHSISISRGRGHEIVAGDRATLLEHAEALKRDDPRARRVVISSAPGVSVEVLAPIMAAVHGTLPELMLLEEPAHQYSPLDLNPYTEGPIGLGNMGLRAKSDP